MTNNMYIIYTDGGSRGNPGPAASGFVIDGPGMSKIAQGEYLGVATNNFAEYTAVLHALVKLKSFLGAEKAKQSSVSVMTDSELLVKQVNGLYKVKNPDLKDLFIQLYNARQDFADVKFTHVRREQNAAADKMVNEALDRQDEPKLQI